MMMEPFQSQDRDMKLVMSLQVITCRRSRLKMSVISKYIFISKKKNNNSNNKKTNHGHSE